MIFNLNDANCELPTTGKAWEILLEHVKENAMHRDLYLGDLDDDDIIEEVKRRELSVGEVFDDQDILDHVHDGGMPIDEIFAEDEILGCGCVIDALEEKEKKVAELEDGWEKTLHEKRSHYKRIVGLEEKVAELEKKNAELEKEIKDWAKMVDEMGFEQGDLERKVAKLEKEVAKLSYDMTMTTTQYEETIAKLEKKVAQLKWDLDEKETELMEAVDAVERVDRLERKVYEFQKYNEKMRCNTDDGWCRRCGSWDASVCKAEGWGFVCEDCLHDLDNDDHEVCKACDCCKDCGCCECEEE